MKNILCEYLKDVFKVYSDTILKPIYTIFKKVTNTNSNEITSLELELSKWNWGAFFLNWFWGIFNKSYWPLFALVPYFGFIWACACGLKGNEWAWKNKKWESIEQFENAQKKWALYGVLFWFLVFSISSVIVIIGLLTPNIK